jgi:hypothetical protein
MTTDQTPVLDIDRSLIEQLDLGAFEVPLVDMDGFDQVSSHLQLDGTLYSYDRSFPVQGHSAVMPDAVGEVLATGRKVLVAERGERYLLYLA